MLNINNIIKTLIILFSISFILYSQNTDRNNKTAFFSAIESGDIKKGDTIHRITENGLDAQNAVGIFNVNLEPRDNGETTYYLPVTGTLSYDSIVTQNNVIKFSDIKDSNLLKIYYTALARERYGLYRPKINS